MRKFLVWGLLGIFSLLGIVWASTSIPSWNNRDLPSGVGDYELFDAPCGAGRTLISVETKTLTSSGSFFFTGSSYDGILFGRYAHVYGPLYSTVPQKGSFCVNEENPTNGCIDYQVRFICSENTIGSQTGTSLQTGINQTGAYQTGGNPSFSALTGVLFVQSADAVSSLSVPVGASSTVIHKFTLFSSGTVMNVGDITFVYTGNTFGGTPNFSNVKAYYYNGAGIAFVIESCSYVAGAYICPSYVGINPGQTVSAQIRADIPYFATGVAKLLMYAVVTKNQLQVLQQVVGLPFWSPLISFSAGQTGNFIQTGNSIQTGVLPSGSSFSTSWTDIDYPSGVGDYEIPISPCGIGNTLLSVSVREKDSSSIFTYTGSRYDGMLFGRYAHIYGPLFPTSNERGVFCVNEENTGGCINYQAKFSCLNGTSNQISPPVDDTLSSSTFSTPWSNIDRPSGVGDYEIPISPCGIENTLLSVSVRSASSSSIFSYTGEKYDGMLLGRYAHIYGPLFTRSNERGVFCVNSDNDNACIDYQVKFLCLRTSNGVNISSVPTPVSSPPFSVLTGLKVISPVQQARSTKILSYTGKELPVVDKETQTFYTAWTNKDTPGGNGDYELPVNPCGINNTAISVSVRSSKSSSIFSYTGIKYDGIVFGKYIHMYGPLFGRSNERGIFCVNSDNDTPCIDYQVRFLCVKNTQ